MQNSSLVSLCIERKEDKINRLITWAFQQLGISAVTAECLDNNVGSIKVLEKLGMHRLASDANMLKWEVRRENWQPYYIP